MTSYPNSAPRTLSRSHLWWALRYAEAGIKVFPCDEDKSPLTGKGGLYHATTDRARIHLWWNRWPDAAIGMPCGSDNGYVAVDLDERTPEAVEMWNSLPSTVVSKTGRASGEGRHALYKVHSDMKIRSRRLADGLELKADGTYIILPPSLHASGNRYEWLSRDGIAELPEEFLQPEPVQHGRRARRDVGDERRAHLDDTAIPEGTRNNTLTSIGGWLRATGKDVGEITAELLTINAVRCEPPLPEAEVHYLARKLCERYPASRMPSVTDEVTEKISAIQGEMWDEHWTNKSDRDGLIALLGVARRTGRMSISGDGVEVSISRRAFALAMAASRRTADKTIERLIRSGWLRKGRSGSGTKSGTLVLLGRAKVGHSNQGRLDRETEKASGLHLRAPRLRHTAVSPVTEKGVRVDTIVIRRLGKTAGAVLDVLTREGPSAIRHIADVLHIKRTRDLRRRIIARLKERGIVSVAGDEVALVPDWLDRLDEERTRSGEKEAHARDKARYARQREAYLRRRENKAHRFTEEDIRLRTARPMSELETVPDPDPELVEALDRWFVFNPNTRCERPSWLATALWAHDYVEAKPTPLDVEVAVAELDERLRRSVA